MSNLVCPFRKITRYEYDYDEHENPTLKYKEEEFSMCHSTNCPFYKSANYSLESGELCIKAEMMKNKYEENLKK